MYVPLILKMLVYADLHQLVHNMTFLNGDMNVLINSGPHEDKPNKTTAF